MGYFIFRILLMIGLPLLVLYSLLSVVKFFRGKKANKKAESKSKSDDDDDWAAF
ncbi:hypothetical protein M2139_002040 [Enterococcus sp. PF1-24]|uniref:hypothetical protein n=1 Tax=unclassified Enterococcus TaxID=2608891 RepID=UPI002474C861|nr:MULTISPECIES: hypothetical protein [unclassified Enterococcus]MDH6365087.1 hypothetical protein [Enterococcus sp. PFB1-1]MDH6402140.1 hypothetical protein [Enterococcus sp. PF1-24]